MADEAQAATVTNFAEFEAAGGKYTPPAEPAKPAAAEEEKPRPEAPAESAAEPETAEEAQPVAEKKPAKPKLTLSDEHAKLLKEVTELRKQRRELQQAPNQQATEQPARAAQPDDKPPVRPKLSTFPGTLEEYEEEVSKYDEAQRTYLERQWERKQADQQAKAEQQHIAEAYGQKLAGHLKEHPEYDEEIAQTPMTPLMVDLVLREGPPLGQALIDNKDLARRIQALAPGLQLFEMGKLAASLNGHAAAAPEPEAEAPQPVKVPAKLTGSGSSSSATAKPDHGAKTYAEWEVIERRLAKRK